MTRWFAVADEGSVPANEGRRVTFGDLEVALFFAGGEYLAVDNRCPHKQGPLADGIVSGKSVFCPLHALKVDLTTGVAVQGTSCVRSYPVKIADGKICIALESGKFAFAAEGAS